MENNGMSLKIKPTKKRNTEIFFDQFNGCETDFLDGRG
jgi:hypothetical protein